MREGVALALKTVAVAVGSLLVVLGALEVATAVAEARSPLLGLALLLAGALLVGPVFARGFREILAERRRQDREPDWKEP